MLSEDCVLEMYLNTWVLGVYAQVRIFYQNVKSSLSVVLSHENVVWVLLVFLKKKKKKRLCLDIIRD